MTDTGDDFEEFQDDDDFDLFGEEDEIDTEALERELEDDRAEAGQYTDRNGDEHKVESYPQDDGTIVVTCTLCDWTTTAEGWSGVDEDGNKVGAKASVFVPALRNAHLLSKEQWPYKRLKPKNNWPNQPPKEGDELSE